MVSMILLFINEHYRKTNKGEKKRQENKQTNKKEKQKTKKTKNGT